MLGDAEQRRVTPQVPAREDRGAERGIIVAFERLDDTGVEVEPLRDLLLREAVGLALPPEPRARIRGQLGDLCVRPAHFGARSDSSRAAVSADVVKSFLSRCA